MLKKAIIFGLIALGFTSCEQTDKAHQTLVHQDGRIKPKLLTLNVIDRSSNSIPWDLSSEFTELVHHQLKNFGSIYLQSPEDLDENIDPYELAKQIQRSPKLCSTKIGAEEFLASVEIIEHKIAPTGHKTIQANAQTHLLTIKARIKVFDLRKNKAELVLSEIVESQTFVPWQLSTINYKKNHINTTQYKVTPIGLGHKQMAQQISERIHDYVLLAKSR